jgi:hypothetical protein
MVDLSVEMMDDDLVVMMVEKLDGMLADSTADSTAD